MYSSADADAADETRVALRRQLHMPVPNMTACNRRIALWRCRVGSGVRHTLGGATILLMTAACAPTRSQWIPQAPPAPPLRGASATLAATRLRIAFPRIPLDSLGCSGLETPPGGTLARRYYFLASSHFPSSRYPDNHFMITGVDAYLPPNAASTPARLDSLLRVSEVTVDEAAGEPPMYVRRTTPTFAVAHYDGTRVVVEIAGEAAVRAFFAAGADSVSLGWCERGVSLSSASVPVRRTPD
jgi:hypothetical protein